MTPHEQGIDADNRGFYWGTVTASTLLILEIFVGSLLNRYYNFWPGMGLVLVLSGFLVGVITSFKVGFLTKKKTLVRFEQEEEMKKLLRESGL